MTKKEFFNKLNNPLDNDLLLETILKSYYKNNNIYNDLIKINTEDKIAGYYNKKDRDEYYLYLFNIWKNNILNYNINYIKEADREVFKKLQNELQAFVPKTYDEIYNFIYNIDNKLDKDVEDYLEKYSFTSQGQYSGWNHISRNYLSFFQTKTPKIKHRLYLNINSTYIDRFAKIFTEKCFENDLPFYYKYDYYGNRADTFVIYSDTNNLLKYLTILEEIKKEYTKDIEENIKKPPVLTATIDNWIGYGSEPIIKSEKKYSYSSLREKVIINVLDRFNKHWTKNHKNKEILINGEKILYKDFLSNLIYETYIEEFNKEIKYTNEEYLDKVYSYKGYSLNDTKKESFRNSLKYMIDKNIDYIIDNLNDLNNIDSKKQYKMRTKSKDTFITINKYIVKKALKKQPYILSKESKNFYNQFREAINKEAIKYNISNENFCFDTYSLKELKTDSKINNLDINNEAINQNRYGLYRLKKDQIIQDLPIYYKGKDREYNSNTFKKLSNKEIEESRKKLGFTR